MRLTKSIYLLLGSAALAGLLTASYTTTNPSQRGGSGLDSLYAKLSEEEKRSPEFAVAGLSVAEGLEATLFAAEPTLTNPTNIDVDHRGRVWVCEAYNYRPAITGNPTQPKGDRILILEDTDGDGKTDTEKVFYQGAELNAPLGILVLGNKVLVSQSPYVWLFTDEDGDDKADKKEVIFQGITGEQHDHGMHAFVFGPDGKLYFNFGNEGGQLLDGQGKPVVGKDGKPLDFKKNRMGIVFRCDPDFTNIEILGNNFRNNYEVAVDSYGTMWQSDNDDDGNKGVRINYVMPYGNYGYTDELTGAGWRANRTNIEAEIPLRHWHLNDPGVVPNLLQTGAGSPTGMVVYEGRMLPKTFQDQMIHCDAGPNVVRSYPVQNDGAGYKATIANVLEGTRDQWFRPSDVCVAPDGSLIVSDWYDPGVGGHQAGDLNRGRIFRVAPANTPYRIPKVDVMSPEGAIEALQNPNMSVRYMAWNSLVGMGSKSVAQLTKLWNDESANPRMRARALWVLSKLEGASSPSLSKALTDYNPNLRITALRAILQLPVDATPYISRLSSDADPQVRRECALALRGLTTEGAADVWAKLAQQHDGKDRWYLEALGIGAEGQWDRFFSAWLKVAGQNSLQTAAGKDIVWRARTKESVPLLASLAGDASVDLKERLRYFRAFDFNPGGKEKSEALLKIMEGTASNQAEINQLALRHLDPTYVKQTPRAMSALQKLLDSSYGTADYIELVGRYGVPSENKRLLALAIQKPYEGMGRDAGRILLSQDGAPLIRATLKGTDAAKATAALASIRSVGTKESLEILRTVALDAKQPLSIRREAVRSLGGSMNGEDNILELLRAGKLSGELKAAAVQGVSGAWRKAVRTEAATFLDGGTTAAAQKHPAVTELIQRKGDIAKGKTVFTMYCAVCHQVNGEGMDFGPKLSEIGSKLPKEGQYLAIFYPSAGISFGYEGYEVKFKDGSTAVGIVSSKTETDLIMKFPGGSTQEYKMSQVKSMKQLDESMMSAGLHEAMSTEELTSLVEYLASLKRK
ncbi:PVC-type heme-binding CxxCH protein [Arundinibacter roseus]|uniref:C-type cytochrome n=1 Tax=Arundinibacter roseus TaxID=2070510 RepID=A0A4R4K8F6_9BACT|nr:PVC-type heme-binding CxxCH protein [Arundinibacter roseus]TDB63967.1 c-type cytochrome [Arundinibacter roseus]